jgi:hypothetical protein
MAVDVDMKVVDAVVAGQQLPDEEDLYVKLKTLQRQMEFLEIQVRSRADHAEPCLWTCCRQTPGRVRRGLRVLPCSRKNTLKRSRET